MASINEYTFLVYQTFNEIIDEYLQSLSEKKRSKALITEDMANKYLQILKDPINSSIANSNMWHQVKNNYSSQRIGGIEILMCKGKPIALKEILYYIIAEEHLTVGHGGARNTYTEVSDKYHGVKRCLVDRFVKKCKTCKSQRKSIKPLAIKPIISKFVMQRLQLWSQGIRYEENIPDNVQIEDDI
ncbi:retrotransposon nucleocapsid protein [Gigaspora margarita]|uniref:Retrotransposon nucleocapsid protein n=1 Tax=Gigaspora margarita TaxID=4874 RepID=A0A8H4A8Y0_GIGMA|nr:retrotransposon nucleocapsid protein [Gigaspora margarita]